jgi:hypothetical protein
MCHHGISQSVDPARHMGRPLVQPPAIIPLARIHSGTAQATDSCADIRYRDHWFWIDGRDLVSKHVFSFLRIFPSIAETGAVPQVPVITIPAN